MSLKKNLSYNFLLSISQVIFPLLSIPYISRVLDPSGIGKINFIDSLTYYFIVIAEFGIVSYGIREVARNRNDKMALRAVVSELLSLHLLTSFIALLIYSITVFFLYQQIGDGRLLLFSFSFLLVNGFSCEWYFWGTEQFQYIAARNVITRVLGLLSIYVLVNAPEDYIIYYGIISLSAITNIIWNFFRLVSEIAIRLGTHWKRHVRPLLVIYLISLVYSVPLFLDNVLLGLISSVAAVAYYAFAMKIVRISSTLITDSLLVFYPKMVTVIHQKNESEITKTNEASFGIIFLFAVPISFGIFLMADDFTLLYFGENFSAVASNLQILSLFPLIKAWSLFLNKNYLMPYDKDKLVLKGLLVGLIVFLPSSVILCYFLGSRGACLAMLFSEVSVMICNMYYVNRNENGTGKISKLNLWQALGSSVIFIPVVYLGMTAIENVLIRVIAVVTVCTGLYFIFLLKVFRNKLVVAVYSAFRVKLKRFFI